MCWFNSLRLYRLTQPVEFEPDALEAALASKPARPCGSQELSTYGFIPPLGKHSVALVHAVAGNLLVACRREERKLNTGAIKDALQDKVDAIEKEQLRKVYKKEKEQLKDEIVMAMLPHTPPTRKTTYAAILPALGMIAVNASSPRAAEDLLSTLRDALGSLPVRPVGVKQAPMATFTDWVKAGDATHGLLLLDECELRDISEGGGIVRCKNQDLTAEEIQNHLEAGKLVTRLMLAWEDKLAFHLADDLAITRLKFEDLLQEQAEQDGCDEAAGQFDASFALMCLTFEQFVPQLIEALGGEEIPQGLGDEPATPPAQRETRVVRAEVQLDAFSANAAQLAAKEELSAAGGLGEQDALLGEAITFLRESRRASISAIQRKLKIGYNRAAAMIEALEQMGIVSPMNSNGSREVIG